MTPCQCATSLFQAFWRLLGFRFARIVEAEIVSANVYTAYCQRDSQQRYLCSTHKCSLIAKSILFVWVSYQASSFRRRPAFCGVHTNHVVISASASASPLPPSSAPPAASLSSRDSLALSPSLCSFSVSSYHDLSIQLTIRSLAAGSML